MSNVLHNPYIKYFFLTIYTLIQGFFLGDLLGWLVPLLPWPYNVILGYILGAIMSVLITFVIFKKWQATPVKKTVVALVLLVFVIITSTVITFRMAEMLKVRAIEMLGANILLRKGAE
jgi:hypothetical protein